MERLLIGWLQSGYLWKDALVAGQMVHYTDYTPLDSTLLHTYMENKVTLPRGTYTCLVKWHTVSVCIHSIRSIIRQNPKVFCRKNRDNVSSQVRRWNRCAKHWTRAAGRVLGRSYQQEGFKNLHGKGLRLNSALV